MIKLSPGELRAATDAAEGLTAAEAATRHGVHVRTIEEQRLRMRDKVGARNIVHAVVILLREGRL